MRRTASLSGQWQFQLDPAGDLTVQTIQPDRVIPVPLPWQAAFRELEAYSGYAWYRRAVEVDAAWLEGEALLRFGAVDYWCQVFVNGELAGEHEGGYTPFSLPIRRWLRAGPNEIAVRVYDAAQAEVALRRWPEPRGEPAQAGPPFAASEVPHGKQEWYLNVGGIWQDVSLTAVPAAYVERVHVTPEIHTGAARVAVRLNGAAAEGGLRVAVRDEAGQTWAAEAPLSAGQAEYTLTVMVDAPRLWDVETPNLYTATATLTTRHGQDEVSARFGFRELAARNGRLLLNGQPLYLLAALDQDLYPETIYTVPADGYLRGQFAQAKALGLNCLRCHIKPPDPRYLDLADEMGLLVWAEIPSWRTFYPRGTRRPEQRDLHAAGQRRVEQTLEEMIARDYNHPALIIWTLVNEDWGTSLPLSASDRAWVRGLYEHCKQLDPTRLVVDNSPCGNAWGPNLHVASDLDDFHVYANIPDQAAGFERAMEQFNLRPAWSFSQHGNARRTGDEPLILSEFGNWGLPSLAGLRRAAGGEPGWFGLGPWWSGWEGEPGYPAGADERFERLGLDAIWPDYEAFAAATQWHQYAALKFEIEAIRRQPNLAGYVITEFTDAYWESNGLLDFYRQPKAYHERMRQVNALDVVSAQTERHAYWDDEAVTAQVHTARYSAADWAGAKLHWRLGTEAGERKLRALARGEAVAAGRASWPLAGQAGMARIELEVRGRGGVLALNDLEVLVLPAAHRRARHGGPVAVADRGLRRALRRLGYRTQGALTPEAQAAVSTQATAQSLEWVRAGGDLLYLDQGNSPFFWTQGRGGVYGGNWLTSFSWIRPSAHSRLAGVDKPLGLPFRHIMPSRTILGLPLEDPAIQPDVLAGMVLGWVGHPSAHTVRLRYGRGRVIMTTFELARALPGDPVAVAMLHDLLEHLVSESCQPRLRAGG